MQGTERLTSRRVLARSGVSDLLSRGAGLLVPSVAYDAHVRASIGLLSIQLRPRPSCDPRAQMTSLKVVAVRD